MSSVSVEMTYHGHQSETQAMQVRFLVKTQGHESLQPEDTS